MTGQPVLGSLRGPEDLADEIVEAEQAILRSHRALRDPCLKGADLDTTIDLLLDRIAHVGQMRLRLAAMQP